MKTIETLTTARQISKEERTFVEDRNAILMRDNTYFYAQYQDEFSYMIRRKTFRAIWNYLYTQYHKTN